MILALILPVVAYFAFSSRTVVDGLRRFIRPPDDGSRRPFSLPRALLLLLPLFLAGSLPALFRNAPLPFGGFAVLLAYLALPVLVFYLRPPRARPLDLFDIAAILLLWMPVEFDLLPDASVPLAGVSIPVTMLVAVDLGFLLFLVIRPLERVGYTFRLGPRDLLAPLLGLLAFALVGMPVGLLTGFIQPGFAPFDLLDWLAKFLAIYFFTAIPEEMLFRGAIQNLIEQRWGRTWRTLLAAAVIFGLAHIDNTTANHAFPNGPYVIMATFAGLAYGWVWRTREKITASALTHTLVNFIWGLVFRS